MLKKILIAAGILVVSTGLTVGILYFLQQGRPGPDQVPQDNTKTVLDHSKDYGACTMLDFTAIKNALGDYADTLQQPENMGIVGNKAIGEGVEDLVSDSQLCIYAFKPGGTLSNGYNSGDAFIIEKIVYTNENGPQSLIKQIETESIAIAVDGLSGKAFYSANDAATGPNAIYSFQLEAFTANTSIKYIVQQPADSATFTAETAKTALVTLAKQSK